MKVSLSLAMIVKDEEKCLERLLRCAQAFCDELVVVDTGSTDSTVPIAQSMGAKVSHFRWIDDFAAARNAAFDQATGDWIIWLDADDVVGAASQAAIRRLKKNTLKTSALDIVYATYQTVFDEQGGVLKHYLRERFVRRRSGLRWVQPVHEYIEMVDATSRMVRDDIVIEHRPPPDNLTRKQGRNLQIYEAALARGSLELESCSPHVQFQYASELQWNGRPADAIEHFQRYLERTAQRPDHVGEQYNATVMLADLLRLHGDYEAALALCDRAIARDGSRAEAFCQAGILLCQLEQWARALPYLKTAAALPVPNTTHALYLSLYGDLPRTYLAQCQSHLG